MFLFCHKYLSSECVCKAVRICCSAVEEKSKLLNSEKEIPARCLALWAAVLAPVGNPGRHRNESGAAEGVPFMWCENSLLLPRSQRKLPLCFLVNWNNVPVTRRCF